MLVIPCNLFFCPVLLLMEMFVLFLSLSFMKYNVLKTLCDDVIVFSQDVLGIILFSPLNFGCTTDDLVDIEGAL